METGFKGLFGHKGDAERLLPTQTVTLTPHSRERLLTLLPL